jgi:hypothetical protein
VQTPRLALALTVAVIVICARIVAGGQTWADVAYHTEVAPSRLAAADQVQRGELPQWWDGTGFGVPLVGVASHGAAYPLVWLAGSARALDWLIVAHLAWLALGIAVWSRRRGAGELAALGAGILAMTAGAVIGAGLRGALFGIAHLPWIAWAAETIARGGRRRDASHGARPPADREARRAQITLGLSLGLVALAGQLGILVDAVVLALVLGAWRTPLAVGAGLLIGAAQWGPVLALHGTAGATHHGIALARLVELVAPVAASPSIHIGASVLALASLAVSWRIAVACAVALALAFVTPPEAQLAVIAVLAAGCAAPGLDQLFAGERPALLAVLGAAVISLVVLAALAFHGTSQLTLAHGGIGIVATLAAVAVAWRAPAVAWKPPIVLALVIAPGVGALGILAPTTERTLVEDRPAWAEALPHGARFYRPTSMPDLGDDLADAIATLAGTSGARWGLAGAPTTDPGRPADTDRTWLAASHDGSALLERFGIAYAIVPAQMTAGIATLGRHGAYALVAHRASPAAAVALDWTWSTDPLSVVFTQPQTAIVLDGHGMPSQEASEPLAACASRGTDGAIDLTCTAPTEAMAVITSSALPGWSATVDDRPVPWVTADAIRRAVPMPAGAHRITWRYRAPGLVLGLVLAGLGIALLVAISLMRGAADRSSDPAPVRDN